MAMQNGTLRLVAKNPESLPADPVGVGATPADAKAAFQTAINNLQAVVTQIPNNAALVSQIGLVLTAADDWATAISEASDTALQNLQNTLATVNAQNAAQQATIKTLQDQLKAAGITPNVPAPGGTSVPQRLPPTTAPAPASGMYTTGQVAGASVAAAIAGWFGHQFYEEYRAKRH